MLKLTNSFCRYSRLTCENIKHNTTIVKQFTYLSCKSKTCIWNSLQSVLGPIECAGAQGRQLANIKKKSRSKKSYVNSDSTSIHYQMSEYLRPSLQDVSYGGEFEISEETTSDVWQRETSSVNKRSHEVPPDFRIWEPIGKNNETGSGFRFKVMSYNILAQYLLESHPYLYTSCLPENLKWPVRCARIYEEIWNLSPDIVCLQEVQVSHVNNFYMKFADMGYFGIFKQKTGLRQDGCAIFFKQSVFNMQDHITVEFYQPGMPILNRDNIGLIMKLAPMESPDTPIVVATTHLLYNPRRTDVRLAQMQVFLAEIDRFAYDCNETESYLPIIITGDFNSTPDSPLIELMDKGNIRITSFRDNSDWKKIGVSDNCQHLSVYLDRQQGITTTDFSTIKLYNSDYTLRMPEDEEPLFSKYSQMFNSEDIGHPLQLSSVYNKVKSEGVYEATTFQDFWVTVDYIYFSRCQSLKLVERLRLPTANECQALGHLPNDHYGSDHLALAATFEMKLKTTSS